MKDLLIVVPARMGSSRLNAKPLQLIGDTPLVLYTVNRLKPLEQLGATIVVASDDSDILDLCILNGIEGVFTPADCRTGTDRAYAALLEFGLTYPTTYPKSKIINVQVDEPFASFRDVIKVYDNIHLQYPASLFQLSSRISDKSVCRLRDGILQREGGEMEDGRVMEHIGIVGFTVHDLREFAETEQTPLELEHKNEYNRVTELGMTIRYFRATAEYLSVNTMDDLEAANRRVAKGDV